MLLALALLMAQGGAQLHAYSHLRTAAHDQAQHHGYPPPCSDCIAYAGLLGAGTTSNWPLTLLPHAAAILPGLTARTPLAPLFTAYRSRAPPALR